MKRGCLRGAAILAVMGSCLATMGSSSARADALGYPWASAPCEWPNGGLHCAKNPSNPAADEYDWGVITNGVFHPYRNGYEYRNCTDYVQWRESQVGVTVPSNWGNGGQWYNNAPAGERAATPKPWDAAVVPGNPGHVAFVESVNTDGTITVSEYNHDAAGDGDTRTATAASMGFTEFVDFGVHPTGGVTSGPGPSGSANGGHAVKGVASGRCVDVPQGSTAPGAQVELWDCGGGANQQWIYNAGQLQVYGSPTMCLDADAATLASNGTRVQIWPCNGGSNQQWTVRSDGTLRSVASGRCLDAPGGATANGTFLGLWDCNGGSNQQFLLH